MMDSRSLHLGFLVIATLAASVQSQTTSTTSTPSPPLPKLDISVYYESLCPDSIAFVTNQLKPTWTKLNKYLSVTLVPFGKANSTRDEHEHTIQFHCHHGPDECAGNKVHACALDVLKSEDQRVPMIGCLMSRTQPKQTKALDYTGCANELKLPVEPLKECVENTTRSDELLYQLGKETNNFQNPLKSVPTIVFRSQYNEENQKKALKDLSSAVCIELSASKLKECNSGSVQGRPVLAVMGLGMLLALFMGRQM